MSQTLGVPYKVCADAYMSQWRFIFDKIQSFEIKHMTPEEFEATRTNFNIPSLGKFGVTKTRYENVVRKFEYYRTHIKNVQNHENPSDVQRRDNDDEQI